MPLAFANAWLACPMRRPSLIRRILIQPPGVQGTAISADAWLVLDSPKWGYAISGGDRQNEGEDAERAGKLDVEAGRQAVVGHGNRNFKQRNWPRSNGKAASNCGAEGFGDPVLSIPRSGGGSRSISTRHGIVISGAALDQPDKAALPARPAQPQRQADHAWQWSWPCPALLSR